MFNFFRGNSKKSESDIKIKNDVKNVIDSLITRIEKNDDTANNGSKRKTFRNMLDSEMTADKIKQWKNDFTFWDTKDGKFSWKFEVHL